MEKPLPETVLQTAVVLMLCCALRALTVDAWAAPLERVAFESAPRRLASGALIPGDDIGGDLARPDGPGPFPAVIGLHGCAGMHEATKQRLADELVAWGYVLLLVDSYATRRGVDQACTQAAFATFIKRRPDPHGALAFLARQSFVDPQRVAVVGFSAGARVALSVAENSFEEFVPDGNLRFRAAAAFYPPCEQAARRPLIPTLIFIGALDDWTPAKDCSSRIAGWGNDGPPVDLIVYPGAYHGFYYTYLQPGRTIFDHWLEYNGAAADDADSRLQQFLDRHLK
jgi:dienelactone hydrolase